MFYLPHKQVVREEASTTKVRMVFDASGRQRPIANNFNECMYTGPTLQPQLWNIMVRARMSTHLLIGDLQIALLPIGIAHKDRDAFIFLFNINGKEEHLRCRRVPFGAEASTFIMEATLRHHFDQYTDIYEETVKNLLQNTYVDNLMMTGSSKGQLDRFKIEATDILKRQKFPVQKWESDIKGLGSDGMQYPKQNLRSRVG